MITICQSYDAPTEASIQLTVDEPVEHLAGATGDTHVRKTGEERAEDERHERKTPARHLGEDLRSVTGESKTVCKNVSQEFHGFN